MYPDQISIIHMCIYRDKSTHTLLFCLSAYFVCFVGWEKHQFLCIVHIQVFLSLRYTYTKTDKYTTLSSFCIANHVFCYKIDLEHTMSKTYLFTHEILLSGMVFLFALSSSEIGLSHWFVLFQVSWAPSIDWGSQTVLLICNGEQLFMFITSPLICLHSQKTAWLTVNFFHWFIYTICCCDSFDIKRY